VRLTKNRRIEQDEVLTAAVAVAFDLGLHAVTAANTAARLGVPDRTVTGAWPDVEDLVATTFSRIVATELAEAKRLVLTHPSPVQQLGVLLAYLAEPADVDAVWLEAWSLGRRNPALGAAVRAEEGAWHAFVASVVRRGVRSGDYFDIDPDEVAVHLLAVIDGVNAYALVGYRSDVDRLRLLRAVARTHLGAHFEDESEQAPLTAV
jgi:AcrR family transcriptional regulator